MARKSSPKTTDFTTVLSIRTQSYADRMIEIREERERFLIVCEGTATEPNYFLSFPVPRGVVDVRGTGRNTKSVVQEAIQRRDAAKKENDAYDQVWCVFDRDSFPPDHFNEALELAVREKISVAFSNEAFEIWYLLHLEYYETGISRQDYRGKLTSLLTHPYEKNSRTIYDELFTRQPDALRNARRLHEQYQPPSPEKDNPCTTVYLLVEQLNLFLLR